MQKFLLSAVLMLTATQALAWGERGHHTICEVATRLVADPDLASFLKGRLHMMGHACNLPDIQWRNLPANAGKIGDTSHFMDPENLGYTLESVPLDFKQIVADKEGKYSDALKRNIVVFDDLGSSWWRYDQFFRLALAQGKTAKGLETAAATPVPPAPKGQPPTPNPAKDQFNAAISAMVAMMGIMGHYVGDASMPYHNTNDYDGWNTGHGGIHSYYETGLVNEINFNIATKVQDKANYLRKQTPTLNPAPSAVERIRQVSIKGFKDFAAVQKLDVVLTPSELKTNPDGTTSKVYATRKPPAEVLKGFEPLIIKEMALSAIALADTWDQIYAEAGKPNLKLYNSYLYPMTNDFIAPDYQVRSPASDKKDAKTVKPSHHDDHQDLY